MLADAFMKGAQEQGHTVNKIEVAKLNISGCKACIMCWTKDGACVQCDDMAEIEPLLESADTLVLVSLLYFFGILAQLKAVIDRLCAYCVGNCKKSLNIKETALIMCGACDEERFFSGAIDTYKHTADYMKWKDRGIIIATSVTAKGDVIQGDWLTKAQAFGTRILIVYLFHARVSLRHPNFALGARGLFRTLRSRGLTYGFESCYS